MHMKIMGRGFKNFMDQKHHQYDFQMSVPIYILTRNERTCSAPQTVICLPSYNYNFLWVNNLCFKLHSNISSTIFLGFKWFLSQVVDFCFFLNVYYLSTQVFYCWIYSSFPVITFSALKALPDPQIRKILSCFVLLLALKFIYNWVISTSPIQKT